MTKKSNIDKKGLVKFEQPATWQSEIDRIKQTYREQGVTDKVELAITLAEIRREKDGLEEQVGICNTRIEALNQMLLLVLEDEGINSFRLPDGRQFIGKGMVLPSVQDREAFYTWVKKNKMEELFTINYQTAAAMIKERMENGLAVPPGVAVFIKESITIVKARTTT